MFEMINNRQVIFGAGEVKTIPKLLAGTGVRRYFWLSTIKMLRCVGEL